MLLSAVNLGIANGEALMNLALIREERSTFNTITCQHKLLRAATTSRLGKRHCCVGTSDKPEIILHLR